MPRKSQKTPKATSPQLPWEGHRARLREKFNKSGLAAFLDYEIIELLLTLGTSRRDCKPQAKEAIDRFKTLRGVLEAPPEELQKIKGITPYNTFVIKLVQELAREFLKEQLLNKPYCKSSKEVFDYLYLSMRDLKKETFRVMFLNAQNQVIEVEDLFEGTLTVSAVYPREIIKKAIKYNAASLILMTHSQNHLSLLGLRLQHQWILHLPTLLSVLPPALIASP